MTRKYLISVTL